MKPKTPVRLWPMHVDKFVEYNFIKEVSSLMMYTPSSTIFHPQGLYSEEIFGQIGSTERLSKLGYIDLHTEVLAPTIFKSVCDVNSSYDEIMKGNQYAVYNKDTHVFDLATKDTKDADTGFTFFMKYFKTLKFIRNESVTRNNKISVIEKAQKEDSYKISKMIVSPAGWRDIRVDSSGHIEVEEINKHYSTLIAMSGEINVGVVTPAIITFFDNIKYNIQIKVLEIYNYFKNMFEGKYGFGQNQYSKRSVALGTRNVISGATLIAKSPDSPEFIKYDETMIPLYQAASQYMPLVVNKLNTLHTSQIYTFGSTNIPAIDPDTFKIKYIEVTPGDVTDAISPESKVKFINNFKNIETRQEPVSVKDINGKEYYLWLVYDLGDKIYLFRNIDDLEILLTENDNKLNKEINIRKINHLSHLDELNLHKDEYVILASTSMIAQGLLDSNTDIDVVVLPDTLRRLILNNNLKPRSDLPNVFNNEQGTIDISDGSDGVLLDFHTAFSNSEVIGGYRFLTVNGLKLFYEKLYQARQKPKYKDVLNILNKYLESGKIDLTKVRPLTKIELLYIATVEATFDKFTTITRYPAIEVGSIYPSKPKVMSTQPSRVVKLVSQYSNESLTLSNYPILGVDSYADSLIIHPAKTTGLGGDYDGDTTSSIGIFTKEAVDECNQHLRDSKYFVSPAGKFYDTASTNAVSFTLYASTYIPKSVELPKAE